MKKWVQRITIKVAQRSKFFRFQHGATIEKSGRIMARGVNIQKPINTLPLKNSIHAEESVINQAALKSRGGVLYVARVKGSNLRNSKPCGRCLLLIKQSGIRKVYYSTSDGWARLETQP